MASIILYVTSPEFKVKKMLPSVKSPESKTRTFFLISLISLIMVANLASPPKRKLLSVLRKWLWMSLVWRMVKLTSAWRAEIAPKVRSVNNKKYFIKGPSPRPFLSHWSSGGKDVMLFFGKLYTVFGDSNFYLVPRPNFFTNHFSRQFILNFILDGTL